MHTNTIKIKLSWIAPLFGAIIALLLMVSQANASIVVTGGREFTDDVNRCLNTYRNAPGIVGDVIRELENSDNEHGILNSTDWSNTSNDIDEATGGSGSGTVTRVDKAELEKYKKRFPELLNKDFCTALLHELWHAVDADRGSRTSHSDTIDGVKRNEVEATIFQNFVHAIRGVDPRTSYGGRDISHLVLVGDDIVEEESSQTDETIQVIEYNGKYLPVNQLIIEAETGCGAEHWHAASGVVKATDSTDVVDPGPQCGYGKVSERPTIEVSTP